MKLKELIIKYAEKYKLPPEVVFGICKQESLLNPSAVRYEPHYRWLYKPSEVKPRICSLETEKTYQKISVGLMQVMGAVYREYGWLGWLSSLSDNPDLQLDYGCKHLSKKIKRYGFKEGILAYNSGSPRKNPSGEYVNAYYYNRVLKYSKSFDSWEE